MGISNDETFRHILSHLPVSSGKETVLDDGVFTVVPRLQSGLVMVTIVDSSASSQGMFAFDVSTPGCVLVTTAANFEATTGVLTGTTGTDAKFTLSAHTDGKLYLENRLAASKNIHWFMVL